MANILVALIILGIASSAVAKIVIEKRKGAKCIGCPYSEGETSCSRDDL
ncbi:MAG: FeoB-associated Cys-rich membrane protein [Bacillota bacterium]